MESFHAAYINFNIMHSVIYILGILNQLTRIIICIHIATSTLKDQLKSLEEFAEKMIWVGEGGKNQTFFKSFRTQNIELNYNDNIII